MIRNSSIWRPFTQEKITAPPWKIVKGEGLYLHSVDGNKYADMISSWWVNIHGHGNIEIATAIAEQAAKLEHVIFTAFSHDPAENLVEKLQTVLPKNLNKFFFSDNGSTSVEVALKMSYQWFRNQGISNRKTYLCLDGAYHGDTYGSMSVSGKGKMYHSHFSDFFFEAISIPVPEIYGDVKNIDEIENEIIFQLERQLELKGNEICALIVEPMLQGACGMVMHRATFLNKLVKLVRLYGILIIFDEVMTGFYRTGKFFAMDYTDIVPDFICISKALTGGFLPLAITISSEKIYDIFLSNDRQSAFLHGHSYTGNPIACAAACKSFEILQRPETVEKIQKISKFFENIFWHNVKKQRNIGTVFAFDLNSDGEVKMVTEKLFEEGIFIRPLGNTIYLFPPYCIEEEELSWVCSLIVEEIKKF